MLDKHFIGSEKCMPSKDNMFALKRLMALLF